MYKQLYTIIKNIFSNKSTFDSVVVEFSIYDAVSLGVITVIIWWLIFS
tara:strand:+ start:2391 stop:2534 length:144 start_codon:yes stop_codon:yes gene_type:complete